MKEGTKEKIWWIIMMPIGLFLAGTMIYTLWAETKYSTLFHSTSPLAIVFLIFAIWITTRWNKETMLRPVIIFFWVVILFQLLRAIF